jgi:hypothetical protein
MPPSVFRHDVGRAPPAATRPGPADMPGGGKSRGKSEKEKVTNELEFAPAMRP